MSTDRTEQLRAIRDAVLNLTESPLYDYRVSNGYYPVLGQGDHNAEIMFIGEAPGKNEAETGRPFCGASGRVLDELLASISLKREDVYVTNILKDRPPQQSRPAQSRDRALCPFSRTANQYHSAQGHRHAGPLLDGVHSAAFGAYQANQRISQLHGTVIKVRTEYGRASVVPLFHPAAALYNASQRETLERISRF